MTGAGTIKFWQSYYHDRDLYEKMQNYITLLRQERRTELSTAQENQKKVLEEILL